jgi:glycerol-3-phosphate dehydrogenase
MIEDFDKFALNIQKKYDLSYDIAHHLTQFYGSLCEKVLSIDLNTRLHPDYPFVKSEIVYAIEHEMAVKPNDIICRRIPLAFLNERAAQDLLPTVVDLMSEKLNWSPEKAKSELNEALENL